MTAMVLVVDQALAAQVAVCLAAGRRRLTNERIAVAEGFDELLDAFLKSARTRQDTPMLADSGEVLDDRPVPLLLSKSAVAELIGVSERTVDRLAATGKVPIVRIGSRTLVRRLDVETYVAALASTSPPALSLPESGMEGGRGSAPYPTTPPAPSEAPSIDRTGVNA